MLRKAISPILFFACFITGCSSISLPSLPWSKQQLQNDPTAEALYDEGLGYFKNNKYTLAIDRFQRVKTEFPFAPHVLSAELKIAEAYYLSKQYPEAAAAFKEFQAMHPTNENIPFVLYHLGLAHFDQFTSIDRDQKLTEIARGYFETVVRDHPRSPHAGAAKEKLIKCLAYLAEHEFYIATFYFQEKKYPAAIDRLEQILRRYRETDTAPRALFYLGESYRLDKNSAKAALAYEALIQYYPNDPLTKTARTYLSELTKERQDPLAMLLKRDGRPAPAALPPESNQQQPVNLVAKKDVTHEQPGTEKGMFRRVLDTLNPLASSSGKSDKKENGNTKPEIAQKTESSPKEPDGFFGSLWRGINPFSKEDKTKAVTAGNSQLLGKVDDSLKQKGIDVGAEKPETRPPPVNLPQVTEEKPSSSNTEAVLGDIDAKLKKDGKNKADFPPPPQAGPVFKAALSEGRTQAASKPVASRPDASGLIANIDESLKRKGIDPAKLKEGGNGQVKTGEDAASSPPPPKRQEKIELEPRLATDKRPFFLDSTEYQTQEKVREADEAGKTASPAAPQQTPPTLPPSVVTGPRQPQREIPAQLKTADQKSSEPGDEESKGVFDRIREDLERIGKMLNPLSW